MKINDWVGPYQFVYRRNDPMRGEVWIFQKDLDCIEWIPGREPSIEDLDLKHHGTNGQ